MSRYSSLVASIAVTCVSAALTTGCCCTVHVVSKDASSHGDGRSFRNGDAPDDAVEVIQIGDAKPKFTSTVTATDGPIRLFVSGHDLCDPQAGRDRVHPEFRVHFHPDKPPQDLLVQFNSPPVVKFAPAVASSGWLYFNGKAPIGETRRVRAVGSGTEFLIEVADDADYVYMLGGIDDWVDVYNLYATDPDAICQTLRYGEYTRVTEDGQCTTPTGIVGDAAREKFLKDASAEVAATGW